jgi:hypothetical protein
MSYFLRNPKRLRSTKQVIVGAEADRKRRKKSCLPIVSESCFRTIISQ